ncbi:hypothetical protein [Methanosphaerula palustris]|nr:hypothetical protein [Methanosphaerula palustris]
MSTSVFSSCMRGAIPDAVEDPGRAIALAPGLNGTVRLYHADRAVHIDHTALRDTAVIHDAARGITRSRFDPIPSV